MWLEGQGAGAGGVVVVLIVVLVVAVVMVVVVGIVVEVRVKLCLLLDLARCTHTASCRSGAQRHQCLPWETLVRSGMSTLLCACLIWLRCLCLALGPACPQAET